MYSLFYWSSEGRSFVMRSLNPCPKNFSQNVVDWGNLLQGGGGGGTNHFFQPKKTFTFLFVPPFFSSFLLSSPPSSFLSLLSFFPPSFLLFLFSVDEKHVIFSQPLIQICTFGGGGGGNLLHEIGSA